MFLENRESHVNCITTIGKWIEPAHQLFSRLESSIPCFTTGQWAPGVALIIPRQS